MLVFRREAFVAGATDPRTFTSEPLRTGGSTRSASPRICPSWFSARFSPDWLAPSPPPAPKALLPDVREAALILLYRLLFILYAEDRDLLPVRDTRYDDYGLRSNVRDDIGRRKDREDVFSTSAVRYWSAFDDLCRAIAHGDGSIGLPPYNGGLFDQARTPLLGQIRLDDAVMATVIDALSFEPTPNGRRYINYRDLGVQQLGSIYERLLEHDLVREHDTITVRPNRLARKGSGSYYTPDDLVGLLIKDTIEPLIRSRMDAFEARHSELATSPLTESRRMGRLKPLDPAEKLLDLKVCDPAMGFGTLSGQPRRLSR